MRLMTCGDFTRGDFVKLWLASAAALWLAACGGAAPVDQAPAWPPFTIRGRLEDPARLLTCGVETDGVPVDVATFRRAIARALEAWTDTGVVRLTLTDDADADVALGFRRGHHGACEPFGASHAVAHSGPTRRGTFVHFDAARKWDEDALFRTALHELGHVLGLGHCERADAVMSSGAVPDRLGAPDLDGLHSLYGGGGPASDRDLAIVRADGTTAAIVRGLGGAGVEHAAFDVDGDGKDELLVWRTDAASDGALLELHFGLGPVLVATAGPFTGVVAPGMALEFVCTAAGERLCLCVRPGGRITALRFDEHGVPVPRGGEDDLAALRRSARAGRADSADLDGDGARETIVTWRN